MFNKEMTILDIVEKYPATLEVFNAYEAKTGYCILCNHLFSTLEQASRNCGLDLEEATGKLKRAAGLEK